MQPEQLVKIATILRNSLSHDKWNFELKDFTDVRTKNSFAS